MKIEVIESACQADLAVLSKGIKSFNGQYLPEEVVYEPDTHFAVFARDEDGNILGGIRAVAYWNYCYIELLWLSESVRKSGVGSKLMLQAEAFAKEKGFKYMRTETLDFQAKPFYEKLGYQQYGEFPNFPDGHTCYCLFKVIPE